MFALPSGHTACIRHIHCAIELQMLIWKELCCMEFESYHVRMKIAIGIMNKHEQVWVGMGRNI